MERLSKIGTVSTKIRNPFQNQKGRATIWSPISFLLVILFIYLIIKYAPIYVEYYQVQQTFQSVVQQSKQLDETGLRHELERNLNLIHAPFPFHHVYLTKQDRTIIIDTRYSVEVTHPGFSHTLHFHPRVETFVR